MISNKTSRSRANSLRQYNLVCSFCGGVRREAAVVGVAYCAIVMLNMPVRGFRIKLKCAAHVHRSGVTAHGEKIAPHLWRGRAVTRLNRPFSRITRVVNRRVIGIDGENDKNESRNVSYYRAKRIVAGAAAAACGIGSFRNQSRIRHRIIKLTTDSPLLISAPYSRPSAKMCPDILARAWRATSSAHHVYINKHMRRADAALISRSSEMSYVVEWREYGMAYRATSARTSKIVDVLMPPPTSANGNL